jgi:hypothetical protein
MRPRVPRVSSAPRAPHQAVRDAEERREPSRGTRLDPRRASPARVTPLQARVSLTRRSRKTPRGMTSKSDAYPRVVIDFAMHRPLSLLRVHSPDTGNNETTAARVGKPSGAKSLCRMAIFRTKPSRGFALQRSCRGDLPNMEHDMSTSAPARVKTILVVDLTHVPNDPFSTTTLGDLRARLIPPTRVGGPGQPPESSH